MKLNLGSGNKRIEGFTNVDILSLENVDVVFDLSTTPWPWEDDSIDEAFSGHFVEHLSGFQRINFFNELYRVLKPGAKATIITPDWSNACAYGDPTHQWPPMSSWYALYLNKEWRDLNAPHVPYTCNFSWVHGVSWEDWLTVRNDEMKQFAMQRYINSARDLHITLTKQ